MNTQNTTLCSSCLGRGGWQDADACIGGMWVDCPACASLVARRVKDRLAATSSANEVAVGWPWPAVAQFSIREETTSALSVLRAHPRGAFLLGPSFAGKTTVARKWCEHRKKEGASVAGVVWPEFIASIKHRGSNQRSAYLNALGDQDVILLDDVLIGSDQATEQDILQGIIDRRREWPQLTTIMTTNITKEAIERMPERIQNRIKLYQPVVMRGHWG